MRYAFWLILLVGGLFINLAFMRKEPILAVVAGILYAIAISIDRIDNAS